MKIGILTLPFNNNYGGYLQCYALMSVLKGMGHDVYLINRRHNHVKISLSAYVKGLIKQYIFGKLSPYTTKAREQLYRRNGNRMMSFVDKYIQPRTNELYSSRDFKHLDDYNFDALIVGSDQVWRAKYVPNIEDFYFSFVAGRNVKRISYAASFGTDEAEYSNEDRQVCGNLISTFDAISVRESSGIDLLCNKYGWTTKAPVEVHLDPTMLLTKEHYEQFVNKPASDKKTLFCYILDDVENKKPLLKSIAEALNCELSIFSLVQSDLPSIEDWLSSIRNAEYVITDSFHGTVFSILFNRQFVALGNINRGLSRFEELLGKFGLNSTLFERVIIDSIVNTLKTKQDWACVNEVLCSERIRSFRYLDSNLKK